jgi:hypothetical protein
MPAELFEIVDGRRLRLHFHPGQWKAWNSEKRFVVVLAGTQGGKSSWGPFWLMREMSLRGPGDYIVVTPTYPLLQKKVLPEFLRLFEQHLQLGTYKAADRVFILSPDGQNHIHKATSPTPTQVFFGHAQDPESLESATAKAAWLDEAGQKKFRLGSWEAIQRRLSIHRGRALITTTPYDLGWLKQKLFDPWKQSGENHPEIDVVRFDSTENPAFPREEFDRARRELPRWRFDLFYRAVFSRPAGVIYDCFDEALHAVEPFPVPREWHRHAGLDFGGANTAAVFLAEHPMTGHLYLYREYHAGARTAAEHATAMLAGEPQGFAQVVGGSKSEDQWRREFAVAGLPVAEPALHEVEVGINRVYAAVQTGRVSVFRSCGHVLDEFASYSRELDEAGQPTEKIEDKETFHRLDALRYIMTRLAAGGAWDASPREAAKSLTADLFDESLGW